MNKWEFLNSDMDLSHFIYNEEVLHKEISSFINLKEQGFISKVYYSVKSNPNAYLLSYLAKHIDGFDISTHKEMQLIENIDFDLKKCTFSGPAKSSRVLRELFEKGIHCLHLDSLDEWREVRQLENEFGYRVNKSIRMKHSSAIAQKLGFSKKEILELKRIDPHSKFQGLHFYLGRESFNEESLAQLIVQIKNFVKDEKNLFDEMPHLYLGLGLPMLNLLNVEKIILQNKEFFKPYNVSFECGRALVQSCGSYCAKVLSIKYREPNSLIIINGGLQHLATKLSSPQYGLNGLEFNQLSFSKQFSKTFKNFDLSGSLGIWHDLLATGVQFSDNIQRDDWIIIKSMGAYGWTSATNQFIGPTAICEWWENPNGEIKLISPNKMKSYLEVQVEN